MSSFNRTRPWLTLTRSVSEDEFTEVRLSPVSRTSTALIENHFIAL